MLLIPWSHTTGWGKPQIKAYGPLHLDPSSSVLHYATTIFEGMKAYKDAKTGNVALFRPDKNMERMNNSAARLAFPVRKKRLGAKISSCLWLPDALPIFTDLYRGASPYAHQEARPSRSKLDLLRSRSFTLVSLLYLLNSCYYV